MEKKETGRCPCCGSETEPRHCLSCGDELVLKPAPSTKSYCNSTCRTRAMRKRRDKARMEKGAERGAE